MRVWKINLNKALVAGLSVAAIFTALGYKNKIDSNNGIDMASIMPVIGYSRAELLIDNFLISEFEKEGEILEYDLVDKGDNGEKLDDLEEALDENHQEGSKDQVEGAAGQEVANKDNPDSNPAGEEKDNGENNSNPPRSKDSNLINRVYNDLYDHLNRYVLDVVASYDYSSGNYPYLLNNDFQNYSGVTEDLYYKGELLLKGHPSGKSYSHCTGITFEVFFKAMQRRNKDYGLPVDDFNGMTKEELFDFALTWYVAKGPKAQSNLAVAIEKYGLGERIWDLEDVAPGDFIDLSRENNTGHAVVFIDWIRDKDGRIIGLKHWSSQQSTNGISHKIEYFNVRDKNGNKYGNVILDSLYIARVNPIYEYK